MQPVQTNTYESNRELADFISLEAEDVRALVRTGELSRASRKIMDFSFDFRLTEQLAAEAEQTRADFNAYADEMRKQSLPPEAQAEKKAAFRNKLLDLVERLEKDALAYVGHSPEPTLASPDGDDDAPVAAESVTRLERARSAFRHLREQASESDETEIAFEGKGLSKTFKTGKRSFTLSEVDLTLRLGELTGIVGENGNGKTVLLNIIAGVFAADKGRLDYPLFNVYNCQAKDWFYVKQHIAYIPQHLPNWRGTTIENLHYTAAVHGVYGRENEEEVEFILHRLDLYRYRNNKWKELSGGYRMRFELARALIWRPRLLILDEPLAHLDINTQLLFLQDLKDLSQSARNPVAVLISSQHLHEIENVADNIVFIRNGQTLYNGSLKDFEKDRQHNTFELSSSISPERLKTMLEPYGVEEIQDTGQALLFNTPVEVTAGEILACLNENGVDVEYFRNISQSTRKLFHNN